MFLLVFLISDINMLKFKKEMKKFFPSLAGIAISASLAMSYSVSVQAQNSQNEESTSIELGLKQNRFDLGFELYLV